MMNAEAGRKVFLSAKDFGAYWQTGYGESDSQSRSDCRLDVPLEAMRNGDSGAWAAVYEQLADRVFQHALYRLAGDREAAEVITQEVFVRAIESIDSYEPQKGTLLGWLRGICRRAIARQHRRKKGSGSFCAQHPSGRSGTMSLSPFSPPDGGGCCPEPVDPRPRPDERLILADEQLLTGAALTSLPYRWEQALRWKYCQDLSVAEIAAELGISEKAAESILSRARAAFRQVYARLRRGQAPFLSTEKGARPPGPASLHEVEDCDE
jgi:RNA polymerase sigma-70 factor, ECF subfamily